MSGIKKRSTEQTIKFRKEQKAVSQPKRSVRMKTEAAKKVMADTKRERQTAEGDATDQTVEAASQALHQVGAASRTVKQRMIRQAQAEQQKKDRQEKQEQSDPQAQPDPDTPASTPEAPSIRTLDTETAAAAPSRRQSARIRRQQGADIKTSTARFAINETDSKIPTAPERMRAEGAIGAKKAAQARQKKQFQVRTREPAQTASADTPEMKTNAPLKRLGTQEMPAQTVSTEHSAKSKPLKQETSAHAGSTGVTGRTMRETARVRASLSDPAEKSLRTKEPQTEVKTADAVPAKTAVRSVKRSGQAATQKAAVQTQAQKAAASKTAAKQTIKKRAASAGKAIAETAVKTVKSALSAIAGAGTGLLVPLIVVVLLGALLCGPLGIFFSSEAENEMTLQQAMARLNTEFSDKIEEIESSVPHDDMQQTGQRAVWKEILTIYAVKTTTSTENASDVVTMDEEHFAVLQEIFWDMNIIDYSTETYTEEVTVEVEVKDENGETHTEQQTQTVERTRLIITIGGKTAEQMAEEYGFDREQKGYVTELLSEEYDELWSLVSVPGGGSDDIVEVALSQLGNRGGQPYWSWYGYTSRVSWCACFVSWCGDQCGYIDAGIMPKFSYCDYGIYWFQQKGQWQGKNYVPSPGDIIFFDWGGDGVSDHVGIVESCDGTYVYTIEGNSSDSVRQLSHMVGSYKIMGYGVLVCE